MELIVLVLIVGALALFDVAALGSGADSRTPMEDDWQRRLPGSAR